MRPCSALETVCQLLTPSQKQQDKVPKALSYGDTGRAHASIHLTPLSFPATNCPGTSTPLATKPEVQLPIDLCKVPSTDFGRNAERTRQKQKQTPLNTFHPRASHHEDRPTVLAASLPQPSFSPKICFHSQEPTQAHIPKSAQRNYQTPPSNLSHHELLRSSASIASHHHRSQHTEGASHTYDTIQT